jgi:chromosome segregation ATPase
MAVEQKEILLKLDFDVKDFSKASVELTKSINQLNEEQKKLKKNGGENSLQFQKNKEDLTQLKREYSENQRVIQNVTKANIENKGSNEQLKATLSVLTQQYNLLGKEERNNIEIGGKLKDQIKGVSDELKSNESAIGNNTRNVGNYQMQSVIYQHHYKTLQTELVDLANNSLHY